LVALIEAMDFEIEKNGLQVVRGRPTMHGGKCDQGAGSKLRCGAEWTLPRRVRRSMKVETPA
jgi:hypothetical protein